MSTPHKYKDLIIAWANGKEIEVRESGGQWALTIDPYWNDFYQYRIKPRPKQNTILKRHIILIYDECFMNLDVSQSNIQFEFDENNNLIKVEMI